MGVGENIDAVIFDLYFDQNIYIKNLATKNVSDMTSFNFTYDPVQPTSPNSSVISICLGKSAQKCPIMPQGLMALTGILTLVCPNGKSIPNVPYEDKIVYYIFGLGANNLDFLIPLAPTKDSFSNLAVNLNWINASLFDDTKVFEKNKLSFMVMNSYTKESIQYSFKSRPTLSELTLCRFQINNNGSYLNYTLSDSNGNPPTGFENIIPKAKTLGDYCPLETITGSQQMLKDITTALPSSRSWGTMIDGLWSSGLLLLTEKLENCTNFLDEKLSQSVSNQQFVTRNCYSFTQSADWLSDPCCNPFYTWSDKCCYARNVVAPGTLYNGSINGITQLCSTPDQSDSLLDDYSTLRNLINDPVNGCGSTVEPFTYKLFNEKLGEAFDCFYKPYYGQITCETSADCPCSTCNIMTGFCLTCNATAQLNAIKTCYINKFPSEIESLARKDWGLNDASKEVFLQEFFNRTITNYCASYIGSLVGLPQSSCQQNGYCRRTTAFTEYSILPPAACTGAFDGTCQICRETGECTKLPFGDLCLSNDERFNNKDICNRNGGSFNDYEQNCYFRPPNHLVASCQCNSGVNNNFYCNRGFCSVALAAAACNATASNSTIYRSFVTSINSCVLNVDSQILCNLNNGTWKSARIWRARGSEFNVTTKKDCESLDLCVINSKIVNNCTGKYICTARCQRCESLINSSMSICYNPNLNRTACVAAKGYYNANTTLCLFPYMNQTSCSADQGMVFETCTTLGYDDCERCSSNDPQAGCPLRGKQFLTCKWNSLRMCDQNLPKEQCEAIQYCHDQSPYPACSYQTTNIDTYGCPICLWSARVGATSTSKRLLDSHYLISGEEKLPRYAMAFKAIKDAQNQNHEDHEDQHDDEVSSKKRSHGTTVNFPRTLDLMSIYGCISTTIPYTQCVASGAKWIKPLVGKDECLAVMGCREKLGETGCQYRSTISYATYDFMTNKSKADCTACEGKYQSAYQWRNGRMLPPPKLFVSWQSVLWTPTNLFIPYINPENLRSTLEKYIYTRTSYSFSTTIDCQTSPIFQTDQILNCDCVPVNGTLQTLGYCYSSKTLINLGKHLFCRGDDKAVRMGKAVLAFSPLSISVKLYCVRVSVSSIGASQFRNQEIVSSSGLLSSLTYKNNPYAIIKNKFNIIVGQLLADGINVAMSQDVFSSGSASVHLRRRSISKFASQRAGSEVNNFTICIDKRSDITNQNEFTILDFATTSDYVNWYPLLLQNVTYDGSKYCASISTNSSVVFPISLSKDWATKNSIFANNRHIQNVMYFLSGAMFVLFLGCIGAIIFQFVRKKNFNISKISLIFLLLYSGLRAAYFLLFALEKLSSISTKNPSGYFVLAELPYYIFISIFILLIIFWWKVSKSTASILKLMLIPVLIVNFCLYSFFVVVCIVAAVVKGNGATVLNKVYKTIVAAIALTLIITAWVFGSVVLKSAYKGYKMRTKGRKGSIPTYLIRTFIILIITSIALLFQIIYLLYITFKAQPSAALSVSVYFLVEVIPAFILFILFAPANEKRKGTGSLRSGPSQNKNNTGTGHTGKTKYSQNGASQSQSQISINHDSKSRNNEIPFEEKKGNTNGSHDNGTTNKNTPNDNEDNVPRKRNNSKDKNTETLEDFIPMKVVRNSYQKFNNSGSEEVDHSQEEVPDFVKNVVKDNDF